MSLTKITLGTGDAKHDFYVIFPYIVLKDGIVLLKNDHTSEVIRYDFPLDNREPQG